MLDLKRLIPQFLVKLFPQLQQEVLDLVRSLKPGDFSKEASEIAEGFTIAKLRGDEGAGKFIDRHRKINKENNKGICNNIGKHPPRGLVPLFL